MGQKHLKNDDFMAKHSAIMVLNISWHAEKMYIYVYVIRGFR